MKNGKRGMFFSIIIAVVIMFMIPERIFAMGSITVPEEELGQDIISVDFPTLQEGEESPFDFIIDPQNLLYETDASLYGGGVVEEGANLLFHNRIEGEYDFSGYSDNLTVTNRSTVPVRTTISARVEEAGGIRIVQDKDFFEENIADNSCYLYLALVDDEGNEQPISEDGEVSICAELNEMFDTYSFGLTGECAVGVDWGNISVHPKVTVTWHADPILTEQKEESLSEKLKEDDSDEDNIEEDTAENSIADGENMPEDIENEKDITDEGDMSRDIGIKDDRKDFIEIRDGGLDF